MRTHTFLGAAAAPLLALGIAAHGCRSGEPARLFLDVHHLPDGQVSLDAVAGAHREDLAVQGEHGVRYERYWVDEGSGTIYCLAHAPSAAAAEAVHREAHGLLADEVHEVRPGILPAAPSGRPLFMDTHEAGPGVDPEDVAEAHRKDLAVQGERGVRFLEYWVDPGSGRIHCLAEAACAEDVVETHRAAHGLLPVEVRPVVAGQ